MNAVELLLRVAAATEGAPEIGANAGPYVTRVLARTGLGPGHPWCAAYVADVGRCALGRDWPLPMTAGCAALGEFARTRAVLLDEPKAGDVFLLWYPSLNRYAHAGFVVRVTGERTVETIEGNTNADGGREGWLVARRTRRLGTQDRVIRWPALLAPASITSLSLEAQ